MNLQRVVDEARPMLEEFLHDVGLVCDGELLDLARLLEPFSNWVDAQQIGEVDRAYVASRLAAFICEYLIDVSSAHRIIEDGRILIRVPSDYNVFREFDPYGVAFGMATHRSSLSAFLAAARGD